MSPTESDECRVTSDQQANRIQKRTRWQSWLFLSGLVLWSFVFVPAFPLATHHWTLGTQAWAAVPRTIHYQGKLTEPDGSPIVGEHTVTLRLYDAATGGAKLWEEAHTINLTRADNGIFSVILGSQTPFGAGITFNDSLWLTTEVDGAGEFSPRQPLSAVGYAINADMLDGMDSTQLLAAASGDLTNLNASNLTSGTVPDARLSANVSVLGSSIESSEVVDGTLTAADTAAMFLTAGTGVTLTKTAASWEIAATGSGGGGLAGVAAGAGLTGGGTSGDVTLDVGAGTGILVAADAVSVDIGTTAGKIVQLDASGALPTLSGINLTNLNASNLTSGTIPDARLSANVSLLGSAIDSAEVADDTLTASDTAAAFLTAGSGISVSKGASAWTISATGTGGDITAVNAGSGLTGGGTSGDVTLSLGIPVSIAHGGTGATTFTAGGLLIGQGTSALTTSGVLPKGTLIVGDGVADPTLLSVGSNQAILKADATQASGLKWATGCMTIGGTDGTGRTATFQMAAFGISDTNNRLDRLWPVPASGTVTTLRAFVNQAPGTATDSWTVRLRKNGANATLSCTITGSATSCSAAGTDTFAAGDRLGVEFIEGGTASSTLGSGWSTCFVPD